MLLLAIDPGTRDLGAARFADGRLTGAWWIRVLPALLRCARCTAAPGEACVHASAPFSRDLLVRETKRLVGPFDSYEIVVAEWPIIRFGGGAKSNPMALVETAAVVAAIQAHAERSAARQYTPSEWKGKLPKDQHQCLILAHLTDPELVLLPRGPSTGRYLTDPLDAVGLGLWYLGRLDTPPLRDPAQFAKLVDPVKPRKPKPPAKRRRATCDAHATPPGGAL